MSIFSRLLSVPRTAPLAFSVAFAGAKTFAADVLVQKYVEGREEIDKRRAAVFLGFGMFQVGFVQYMVYSKLFPCIFKGAGSFSKQTLSQMARDKVGLKNVLKQVGLDLLVYHPLCYFPVFYTCQEVRSGNVHNPGHTVDCAMQKYLPNALDDCKGLWQVFLPVSFFQNSVCPLHLRVPCVATAGFFYGAFLSMSRGNALNATVAQKDEGSQDVVPDAVGVATTDLDNWLPSLPVREWGATLPTYSDILGNWSHSWDALLVSLSSANFGVRMQQALRAPRRSSLQLHCACA
jgi:hypothetical protein